MRLQRVRVLQRRVDEYGVAVSKSASPLCCAVNEIIHRDPENHGEAPSRPSRRSMSPELALLRKARREERDGIRIRSVEVHCTDLMVEPASYFCDRARLRAAARY
jgi:hypothetical protein